MKSQAAGSKCGAGRERLLGALKSYPRGSWCLMFWVWPAYIPPKFQSRLLVAGQFYTATIKHFYTTSDKSFIKTLKCEEVYLNEYETFEDALKNIWHFIEKVYNKKRLHSALDYRSPDQFEMEVALNTIA